METLLSNIHIHQLRQVNDLTRSSIQPGNLDYNAYRQYLLVHGHVSPEHVRAAASAPAIPQTSFLQAASHDRNDNQTDFRADQALWTERSLPDIIYVFERPKNWLPKHFLKEPPNKTYLIYGELLRDIPILPDHVSGNLEGWRIEAWTRFDPRVSLMDLINRMEPGQRPNSKSVINMRTLRFRRDCKVLGWVATGKTHGDRKGQLLAEMAAKNINPQKNSTRGISWGLIDVAAGEAGGRVQIPANKRFANTVDMGTFDVMSIQPALVHATTDRSRTPTSSESSSGKSVVAADDDKAADPDFVPDDHVDDFDYDGTNDNSRLASEVDIDTSIRDTKNRQDRAILENHHTAIVHDDPITINRRANVRDGFFDNVEMVDDNNDNNDNNNKEEGSPTNLSCPPVSDPNSAIPTAAATITTVTAATTVTVTYAGHPLTLKTAAERRRDADALAVLRRE